MWFLGAEKELQYFYKQPPNIAKILYKISLDNLVSPSGSGTQVSWGGDCLAIHVNGSLKTLSAARWSESLKFYISESLGSASSNIPHMLKAWTEEFPALWQCPTPVSSRQQKSSDCHSCGACRATQVQSPEKLQCCYDFTFCLAL